MDSLPVELIQNIIRDHLPRGDQLTFSLVSKQLRAITLGDALSAINMKGSGAVNKWGDLSDDSKNRIQTHCCSLSCTITDDIECGSDKHYQTFFTQYLAKFVKLTSLRLAGVPLADSKLIDDIRPHIKELILDDCLFTLNGFPALVSNFPELTHLTLSKVRHRGLLNPDPEAPPPRPNLSTETWRKISIVDSSRYIFPILNCIFSVPWDEVSIFEGIDSETLPTQCFIDRAGGKLKRLDLQENVQFEWKASSLSKCKKLRELKIRSGCDETSLISTIESMEIRKIIITQSKALSLRAGDKYWVNLENVLLELVNRDKYKGPLEVEIQVVNSGKDGTLGSETVYLQRFRNHKNGRVKFVNREGRAFLFPSQQFAGKEY